MAWKWCENCDESFGECHEDSPDDLDAMMGATLTCNACLRWQRTIERYVEAYLRLTRDVHFVYGWVELDHEPSADDYIQSTSQGEVFYIGRGRRKRLTDIRDRNPHAVERRLHLSKWRSFGFVIFGGFRLEADAKAFEESLISLFAPTFNLQKWNQ